MFLLALNPVYLILRLVSVNSHTVKGGVIVVWPPCACAQRITYHHNQSVPCLGTVTIQQQSLFPFTEKGH